MVESVKTGPAADASILHFSISEWGQGMYMVLLYNDDTIWQRKLNDSSAQWEQVKTPPPEEVPVPPE